MDGRSKSGQVTFGCVWIVQTMDFPSTGQRWVKPGADDLGRELDSVDHFGVGTKSPVGRNSSVRISTTNETMTA